MEFWDTGIYGFRILVNLEIVFILGVIEFFYRVFCFFGIVFFNTLVVFVLLDIFLYGRGRG